MPIHPPLPTAPRIEIGHCPHHALDCAHREVNSYTYGVEEAITSEPAGRSPQIGRVCRAGYMKVVKVAEPLGSARRVVPRAIFARPSIELDDLEELGSWKTWRWI
jgi:hypothetical protein